MVLSAQREWTILLYTMADDKALRGFANETLLDIRRALLHAGSAVKVAAQVTLHSNATHPIRRYDFEDRSSIARHIDVQNKLQYVPRKDITPRRNLVEFLRWGQQTYPAKHYCVVLQGHAWGADYTIPSFKLTRHAPEQAWHEDYRLILGSPRSKNHLTNKDLQAALTSASARGKFDLLGMDSCLMSMAEVLYELHGCTQYSVAPEGLGPIRGWPFYPILRKLSRQPAIPPAQLGTAVLDLYAARYRTWGGDVKLTIALCSLSFADELMLAMQALVPALLTALHSAATRAAIVQARVQCPYFRIPTYIDLLHFCRLLQLQPAFPSGSPIHEACSRVQFALHGRFVQKVALQRGRPDVHGLSIYFPKWRVGVRQRASPWKRIAWTNAMATPLTYNEAAAKVDAAYLNHQFADRCGWKKFLLEFLRARLVV